MPNSSRAREQVILKRVMKSLRDNGFWVLKIHGSPFQHAGLPDVLAIRRKVAIFVETKRPGGKPSKLQLVVTNKIKLEAGSPTVVVSTVHEAETIGPIMREAVEEWINGMNF